MNVFLYSKGETYAAYDQEYVDNLNKEIERLNKELDYYKKEEELYRYYQQEVPRLENIINELEKDTINLMKSYENINAPRYDMCKYFIYKIQELKEGKYESN